MALIAALLTAGLFSVALGAITLVAGLERRAAAAHRLGVVLRAAADGALAVAVAELDATDWGSALSGTSSNLGAVWGRPAERPFDATGLASLTSRIRQETEATRAAMMGSGPWADTPAWQLYAHAPWDEIAGDGGPAQVAVWVADDWAERDGDPHRDTNLLLLLRAAAASGAARAGVEALCGRDSDGRLRVLHIRFW